MQVEKLRSLIRESINEYIREIDAAGDVAALEAKELKCEEAIQLRQERLNKINENDDLKEMVDEAKMKTIQNEIKLLEKAKKKYAAQKAKMQAKKDKKANPEKEVTTDASIEEADVTAEMDMDQNAIIPEMNKEEALNESFLKMQKLAGLITESQFKQQTQMLNEGYKFNDADEDTAKEIKNKIKPAVESTLKKAMMDVATKNPELKGAPNYGLAIGLIAYDIVMSMV
jgi:hypothetical protein